MIAAGQGRDAAADFLDGQYARIEEARRRISARARAWNGRPTRYDASILRHASRHGVDPALIRAVMAAESGFDPAARSSAGAIGLMQLMPMTARELGVDPFVPEQNIEGGVRYLSQLLKTFGGVEMALVAYNAGPGFAQRYARGQTALYGETRVYVRNVLARLQGT
jgi:soluble lytic murein transglycosylase-like protein